MSAPEEELREIGKLLPPELAADLRAAHDELKWDCAALNEGQTCCVDLLLGPAEVKVYAQAAAAVGGAGIEGV
jgi:hypothetical protein